MIPGFSQLDYMTRLIRLNLWTLEERRNRSDLIELFKIYKGLSGIKVESMFEPSTQTAEQGAIRWNLWSTEVVWIWGSTSFLSRLLTDGTNYMRTRFQLHRSTCSRADCNAFVRSRQAFTRTFSVLQASRPHLGEVNLLPGPAAPGNSPVIHDISWTAEARIVILHRPYHILAMVTNHPLKEALSQSHDPFFKFCRNHIFVIGEARYIKFRVGPTDWYGEVRVHYSQKGCVQSRVTSLIFGK